jgi:hypothetical protein
MDLNLTLSPAPRPIEPPTGLIPPIQVWTNLSAGQQQSVEQMLVLICRELIARLTSTAPAEVLHD